MNLIDAYYSNEYSSSILTTIEKYNSINNDLYAIIQAFVNYELVNEPTNKIMFELNTPQIMTMVGGNTKLEINSNNIDDAEYILAIIKCLSIEDFNYIEFIFKDNILTIINDVEIPVRDRSRVIWVK